MGPGTAIISALRQGFRFSGRSGRAEFWWAFPILFLLVFLIMSFARLPFGSGHAGTALMVLAYLAVIPILALGTRRLADAGMPRWLFVASWLFGQMTLLLYLFARPALGDLYAMNFQAERNDVALPLAPADIHNILRLLRDDILPWAARIFGFLSLALAALPSRKPAIIAGTTPAEV